MDVRTTACQVNLIAVLAGWATALPAKGASIGAFAGTAEC